MPDGVRLYYNLSQFGPDFAILLFGEGVAGGSLEPVSTRAVADVPCHTEIRAIVESLSIDWEDV